MEFLELAKKRGSVRGYKTDPVEDEKLKKVLEAANLAPTAANKQPFNIVVVHTKGREDELKQVYNRDWFVQAPLLICICGAPGQAWVRAQDGRNYCDVDVAIAMDHLVMEATDLGLGTCWIAAFDPDAARRVLGLPPDVQPMVFTPLGYATSDPRPKKRKELSELVKYERW